MRGYFTVPVTVRVLIVSVVGRLAAGVAERVGPGSAHNMYTCKLNTCVNKLFAGAFDVEGVRMVCVSEC